MADKEQANQVLERLREQVLEACGFNPDNHAKFLSVTDILLRRWEIHRQNR